MPDRDPYVPSPGTVTIFSAPWCGYCTRLKADLDRAGIGYTEIDIDQDAAAAQVAADANGGDWIIPTVVYADGGTQVNPGVLKVQATLDALA